MDVQEITDGRDLNTCVDFCFLMDMIEALLKRRRWDEAAGLIEKRREYDAVHSGHTEATTCLH